MNDQLWVVVGVIAYAGDTVLGVFSEQDRAEQEAARLNREGDTRIYDDGFDVRRPFVRDAPAREP
jgi:predicted DNA-binding WGR domain protein